MKIHTTIVALAFGLAPALYGTEKIAPLSVPVTTSILQELYKQTNNTRLSKDSITFRVDLEGGSLQCYFCREGNIIRGSCTEKQNNVPLSLEDATMLIAETKKDLPPDELLTKFHLDPIQVGGFLEIGKQQLPATYDVYFKLITTLNLEDEPTNELIETIREKIQEKKQKKVTS
jgi:hypothetical protein